jgi:thiamine biosynthesis lipoprotein
MHPPAPPRRLPAIDGGLGIDQPQGGATIRRFSHEAMATVYELYIASADHDYASQAARAAFDLIDRLENELSRFIPNSDISRVSQLAAGEATRVGAAALECLLIARHMFELTGGRFDVSIGTGLLSLEIDAEASIVRSTRSGVRVDLGGIGKGYAVDLIGELLEEWELGEALVHGGFSSVLALEGPSGAAGWPLTLSDPNRPSRVLTRLNVHQAALGASGIRKKDHIVDPRTGVPVRGRLASWAAVPRPVTGSGSPGDGPRLAAAAVTDALTTALMMLSPEEIGELCKRSPGLEAWILPEPIGSASEAPALIHFGTPAV